MKEIMDILTYSVRRFLKSTTLKNICSYFLEKTQSTIDKDKRRLYREIEKKINV